VVLLIDFAYAQNAGGAGGGGGASMFTSFVPLILIFAIFYFLLIRPQQTKAKKHKEFLNNLHEGTTVMTSGGIHGEIKGITDTVVTLEIANNVRIKVSRDHIAGESELKDITTSKTKKG
jgi:preprotein translocase subunit YajC